MSSIISAGLGLIGANKSAKAQNRATDNATAIQKQIFDQQREDYMPYQKAGSSGVNTLSYLLGVTPDKTEKTDASGNVIKDASGNPTYVNPFENVNTGIGDFGQLTKSFGMDDYQQDPGYQFRLDQGQKALDRANAARGNFLSGNAVKELQDYNQGMASQEYGAAYDRYNNDMTNLYNRLAGLTGTGQTATNSLSSLGQAYGNNMGNLALNKGDINAAKYQAQAGYTSDLFSSLFGSSSFGGK